MSLGNSNAKQGDKGSRHGYEFRSLRLLGQLVAALPPPPGGLATEATLISVLNAIVASDQDIEILLVRDKGNGDLVVQQITDYQTGVPVISYKDVSGAVYVPTGPLEYLDPSAVLNLILTQVTAINNAIDLEVDDDAIAVEQELPTNINLLYGAFEGEGVEWERIQTDGNGYLKGISDILIELGLIKTNTNDVATQTTLAALEAKLNSLGQKLSAGSAPVVLSTEQEAILTAIDNVLDTIKTDTAAIDANTDGLETLLTTIDAVLDTIKVDTGNIASDTSTLATPVTTLAVNMLRVTGGGAASVAAGKRRVSFFNAGNNDSTVAGATLKKGEVVTFNADGLRDTLASISYDALTSELLITTVG